MRILHELNTRTATRVKGRRLCCYVVAALLLVGSFPKLHALHDSTSPWLMCFPASWVLVLLEWYIAKR